MSGTIDFGTIANDGTTGGDLLILGATGCLGGALVDAALQAGHRIVATGRDADALAALQARHPEAGDALTTLQVGIVRDADAADLVARLRMRGRPLTGVIAAIRGTPMRARLLDQPEDFLRRRLDEDLLPHLFAARRLLPLLVERPGAGYVLIGGPGADQPWAGYGHHSIVAAALRMLARVLHDEARAVGVRVHLLGVDGPLRTDDNAQHACTGWPHVGAVARRALSLLDRDTAPRDAVVRYADAPSPPALRPDVLRSDDIDASEQRPAIAVPRAAMPPATAGDRNQDDARRLLHDIVAVPLLRADNTLLP